MTRWMPGALILACAALGAGAAVQAVQLRRVKLEADRLRGRVERLESRQDEAAASARASAEEIREQVARLEKTAAAPPPPPAPPPAPAAEAPASPAATAEDIRRIVDEKVEEKIRARDGAAGGDRKVPLHDLAKELGLEPGLQPPIAEIANAAKREIFDLLRTPRPDGTSLADELLDAFLSGDAPLVQKTFLKVLTEKVPGRATTYLEETARIQERGYRGLEQAMGPDAYARFRHMNVHPENIETGFDPWGEYLRQRPAK